MCTFVDRPNVVLCVREMLDCRVPPPRNRPPSTFLCSPIPAVLRPLRRLLTFLLFSSSVRPPAARPSGRARERDGAEEVVGRGPRGWRRTGQGRTACRALLCAGPCWGEQIPAACHAGPDARTRGPDARTAGSWCSGDSWKGVACVFFVSLFPSFLCVCCFVLFLRLSLAVVALDGGGQEGLSLICRGMLPCATAVAACIDSRVFRLPGCGLKGCFLVGVSVLQRTR